MKKTLVGICENTLDVAADFAIDSSPHH